jgi:hypothetical protein
MPGAVVSWSAVVRRLVFRQKYRAHIRAEQEEFLREHPELRLPPRRPARDDPPQASR